MLGGRCDHREGGKGALALAEGVRAMGGGRARGRWGALASAGGGPLPDEVFGVAALASLPSGGGATTFVLLGFGGGGGR